ncbi:MAG: phytol kinase [Flavobacteriaceae bacterium]|jgi:phytol kinase
MNVNEFIALGIYSSIFLALFALGEILFHVAKMPVEMTRKIVHIITGLICLTLPAYVGSHWTVLFLTVSFILILVFSMKWNLLKSINSVNRKTIGSFLFPVSVYLTYWAFSILGLNDFDANGLLDYQTDNSAWYNGAILYYYLPILILAISDPMATLVGRKLQMGKFKVMGTTKTLIGSLGFLVSTLIISYCFISVLDLSMGWIILVCTVIALVTTVVEALSQKGFDNILIPLSTLLVLYLFRNLLMI